MVWVSWLDRIQAAAFATVVIVLLSFSVVSVWALGVSPPSPVAGQSFTLSGLVSGPDTLGVFSGSGCSGSPFESFSVSGSYSQSVSGLHAGQYSAATAAEGCLNSFTVVAATTGTTVTCGASTLNVGSMMTCTATVSDSAFGSTSVTGDTISWSDAGSVSFSSASCTLSGSSCSVTVTGTGAGSASVKGAFSGDGDNDPSSGTFPISVNAVTTGTSVNCSPSAIDVGGSTSSCTATVSGAQGSISAETITFSQSGGAGTISFPSGSTCNLSGASCMVTVAGTGVGSVTVKASYPGDSNNVASSGTFSLTVNSMLVAPTVTVTQAVLSQGQSTTLSSSPVTTGTPPYTYQWLVKGPTDSEYSPIPGATSASYTFTTSTSTAVGVWSFELKVTDSDPSIISTPVTVTVNPAAPPIPEYPLGLPILAIFMIIGYGLVRRRTRKVPSS